MFDLPENLSYKDSWKNDAGGGDGFVGGVKNLFSGLIKNADDLAESNVGKMAVGYFVNRENNRASEKVAEIENKNRYQAHSQVESKGRLISEAGSQQVFSVDYKKYIPAGLLLVGIPFLFYLIKR